MSVAPAGRFTDVRAVGIAVPVHDEESLLDRCLVALERAVLAPALDELTVSIAVVLDRCQDRSEHIADLFAAGPLSDRPRCHVSVISVGHGNVGASRRSGLSHALGQLAPASPTDVWLATTDGDSAVPPEWITHQIRRRQRGADAWAGTVVVDDWQGRTPHLEASYQKLYLAGLGGAGHVHGTSFGCTAEAYLAAGEFPTMASGEDHGLWAALGRIGAVRVQDVGCPVVTSARRFGRAPSGFAGYLNELEGQC